MDTLVEEIANYLVSKNQTLSVAESCTGGGLSSRIVSVSGISKFYLGAIVAYSNNIKKKLLNVPEEILEKYGAVSEEVALFMAKGALELCSSNWSIATTGIAGPEGGSLIKPVGTVCIAIAGDREMSKSYKLHLEGTRKQIIQQAIDFSLIHFLSFIKF